MANAREPNPYIDTSAEGWPGLSRGKKLSEFSQTALERGARHEEEHVGKRYKTLAKRIAADHLTEDPRYYEHLEALESARREVGRLPRPLAQYSLARAPNPAPRAKGSDATSGPVAKARAARSAQAEEKKRLQKQKHVPAVPAQEALDPRRRKELENLVWKNTHPDFRGQRDDGTRAVLHNQQGKTCGTESWSLASFSDEQLVGKLPRKLQYQAAMRYAPVFLRGQTPKQTALILQAAMSDKEALRVATEKTHEDPFWIEVVAELI